MYQPRGVGLMHTQHKPGDTHYTHDNVQSRKCCYHFETMYSL